MAGNVKVTVNPGNTVIVGADTRFTEKDGVVELTAEAFAEMSALGIITKVGEAEPEQPALNLDEPKGKAKL